MVKTLFKVWLAMLVIVGSLFGYMYFGNPFYTSDSEVNSLNMWLGTSTFGNRETLPLAGHFKSAQEVGHNKFEIVTTTYRKYTVLAVHMNIEPGSALYKAEGKISGNHYSGLCQILKTGTASCYHYAN